MIVNNITKIEIEIPKYFYVETKAHGGLVVAKLSNIEGVYSGEGFFADDLKRIFMQRVVWNLKHEKADFLSLLNRQSELETTFDMLRHNFIEQLRSL